MIRFPRSTSSLAPENTNTSVSQVERSSLVIPAFGLSGFTNETPMRAFSHEETLFEVSGNIKKLEPIRKCILCGKAMGPRGSHTLYLRHLPCGGKKTQIKFNATRFRCVNCHHSQLQVFPFKGGKHRITTSLFTYIESLLSIDTYLISDISRLTGIDRGVIRKICDVSEMEDDLYIETQDVYIALKNINKKIRVIGINEFSLDKSERFATHILDQETGEVLWVAENEKKQAIYDFIDYYGFEFMKNIKVVICTMNSEYEEVIFEKFPGARKIPQADRFSVIILNPGTFSWNEFYV